MDFFGKKTRNVRWKSTPGDRHLTNRDVFNRDPHFLDPHIQRTKCPVGFALFAPETLTSKSVSSQKYWHLLEHVTWSLLQWFSSAPTPTPAVPTFLMSLFSTSHLIQKPSTLNAENYFKVSRVIGTFQPRNLFFSIISLKWWHEPPGVERRFRHAHLGHTNVTNRITFTSFLRYHSNLHEILSASNESLLSRRNPLLTDTVSNNRCLLSATPLRHLASRPLTRDSASVCAEPTNVCTASLPVFLTIVRDFSTYGESIPG